MTTVWLPTGVLNWLRNAIQHWPSTASPLAVVVILPVAKAGEEPGRWLCRPVWENSMIIARY